MMVGIPYDTGNLRSSFKMPINTDKKLKYAFDDSIAYYVDYLEEGIGFVTKHKDFIKNNLMNIATQELIYFIKTGNTGLLTTKPSVVLRKSIYSSPIGYERKILNALNMHGKNITAHDRKSLSKIWGSLDTDENITSTIGLSPLKTISYKRSELLDIDTNNY
jgi:uncharacterized phage-like protein YoqJ